MKRVFLIVLDSVGIGEMPDAELYGDKGSNTFFAVSKQKGFNMPKMHSLGLFNIDGITCGESVANPQGSFARMMEKSKGKDTTIGHWEISGIESDKPLPTFPNGFPMNFIEKFEEATGKKVLCNKPYSGTDVLRDYGKEHAETGALIVYTSADSVFQIAAHEGVVPLEELYNYCKIARKMLVGDLGVGRVIARPFIGDYPNYQRTTNRHDFSLQPPKVTMLDQLLENGKDVIAVGKINDIFAGKGISRFTYTKGNTDGMKQTIEIAKEDFDGICFVNLVDFDMLYGHRNDPEGYAKALSEFDSQLTELCEFLKEDDVVIITADHGCDPSTPSTDHSREYTPMVIFGNKIRSGVNLDTRSSFADIGATILEFFEIKQNISGKSFFKEVFR